MKCKKKAMEKATLLQKPSSDYASGFSLDIRYGIRCAGTKKKMTKRIQCKCDSTMHLTSRSKDCSLNKTNLKAAKKFFETKVAAAIKEKNLNANPK